MLIHACARHQCPGGFYFSRREQPIPQQAAEVEYNIDADKEVANQHPGEIAPGATAKAARYLGPGMNQIQFNAGLVVVSSESGTLARWGQNLQFGPQEPNNRSQIWGKKKRKKKKKKRKKF